MLSTEQAKIFAQKWLPAWSGNRPDYLISFYSEDAFYSDPGMPKGVKGRDAVLASFEKLLGYNPDWVWTQTGSIPMEDGFVNQWHASIPVGEEVVEIDGVCLVQLREGKIYRNQVYFDTQALNSAIARQK